MQRPNYLDSRSLGKAMITIQLVTIILSIFTNGPDIQDGEVNLVPNPGFEQFSGVPLGWFYTGKDFTRVMRYWESPSSASPDVYGPRVKVPSQWQRKGFGQQTPHSGKSMAGITLYGCVDGKPHCREYLQIPLNETLVVGQRYYFECWLSHLPRSMRIDALGVHFSPVRVFELTDEVIRKEPQILAKHILEADKNGWVKFNAEFIADTEADYLIIGNFYSDAETKIRLVDNTLKYAYYYMDDFLLHKLPPILDVPIDEDDLSLATLEKGKVITLNNIYFDFDKADFLPRSYRELNTLLEIMLDNQDMVIEIRGHTDNYGSDRYNMDLSIARAKAVVDFLLAHAITDSRVRYRGFGSKLPIATNDTEEGRQKNRRVEFYIDHF